MPVKHSVFTQLELEQLTSGKLVPLSRMRLGESLKNSILRSAKKKLGPVAPDPLHRFVHCKMVGEAVVCKVMGEDHGGPLKHKKPRRQSGKRAAESTRVKDDA